MPGPCKNCGAPHAAFGYRRKGSWSRLPESKRTMIFVCGAPECRARAEAWKRKADGEGAFPRRRTADPPKPKPKTPPKAEDAAQGSLF